MKKITALLLTMAIAFMGLTACGGNGGNAGNNAGGSSQSISIPDTFGGSFLAVFVEKAGQVTTAEAMAAALIDNEDIPFMAGSMPVEAGWLNGFTEEISGFSEGAQFGPMISTIPFIGYIFVVDSDVEGFKENLKNLSDPRWNICTEADETIVESIDNMVFFLMSPATYEEE